VNWEQLKTILWLRWRLTRNQWIRGGGLGAVFAAIVAAAMFILGAASFVGALLGGIFGLGDAKPVVLWGIWLGLTVAFLFVWLLGLLNELQRSESIDLQRLMHLPVALGQMFVVNYVASHLVISVIIFVPAMMGLTIGLVISRGPVMLLLAPLALGLVFMITAWTYCLRGWLATLMSNPRRRRSVIMGITAAFILLAQGPNLYFNVLRRFDNSSPGATPEEAQRRRSAQNASLQEKYGQLLVAQKFIPPLWLPLGAQRLAEGRAWPAFFGMLGCIAIGALGLRRAYRSTVQFYYGGVSGKTTAQAKPARVATPAVKPAKAGTRFLELCLPGLPEPASALALATFRSMLRAPEIKMAWASSFIVTLIMGGTFLLRATLNVTETMKPFIATGVTIFSIFMLVQFFANQFGFDRDGFRALILSPAERRHILLGKNLACVPVSGFGVVLIVLVSVRLHLPPSDILGTLFQLATLLLLATLLGNLLSILTPYRIQAGSMKPTKMPALATLVLLLSHMLFPLVMAPVLIAPLAEMLWRQAGWPAVVPVNLIISAGSAAVAAFAYWQALGPLGRLLQRRETKILSVVTVEVE
jgi:hypothetical protein